MSEESQSHSRRDPDVVGCPVCGELEEFTVTAAKVGPAPEKPRWDSRNTAVRCDACGVLYDRKMQQSRKMERLMEADDAE